MRQPRLVLTNGQQECAGRAALEAGKAIRDRLELLAYGIEIGCPISQFPPCKGQN
jgi:hypothetical protein